MRGAAATFIHHSHAVITQRGARDRNKDAESASLFLSRHAE